MEPSKIFNIQSYCYSFHAWATTTRNPTNGTMKHTPKNETLILTPSSANPLMLTPNAGITGLEIWGPSHMGLCAETGQKVLQIMVKHFRRQHQRGIMFLQSLSSLYLFKNVKKINTCVAHLASFLKLLHLDPAPTSVNSVRATSRWTFPSRCGPQGLLVVQPPLRR